MKRFWQAISSLTFIVLFATACTATSPSPTTPTASVTTVETTMTTASQTTQTTVPTTTTTVPPLPEHSAFYVDGVDVEQIIDYFKEVCLDAEFVESGDPTIVQKWTTPIGYKIIGNATEEDLSTLASFVEWLNTIEGFPGIHEVVAYEYPNLQVYFNTEDIMQTVMGDDYQNMDGAVRFWYNDANQIYDATIFYRSDIDQSIRNSVILEEIYNGLGPLQDTSLREDSIIFAGYSTPQTLTAIDECILKLLYHPSIQCGMNADECEAVIRELYY